MKQTDISNLADRDITEVSGRQLQRAGICCAIINEPDIIFSDEPTGALNSKTTLEILEILRRVNEQCKTLAVFTHDAKVVSRVKRVLFMLDEYLVDEMKLGKYHRFGDEKIT